jgi:hypothetical protein
MASDPYEDLYKLVYDATAKRLINMGGDYGMLGMHEPIASELLKSTAEIVGKHKANKLAEHDLDEYIGACQVAVATGVLTENDIERIADLLEAMEKEL